MWIFTYEFSRHASAQSCPVISQTVNIQEKKNLSKGTCHFRSFALLCSALLCSVVVATMTAMMMDTMDYFSAFRTTAPVTPPLLLVKSETSLPPIKLTRHSSDTRPRLNFTAQVLQLIISSHTQTPTQGELPDTWTRANGEPHLNLWWIDTVLGLYEWRCNPPRECRLPTQPLCGLFKNHYMADELMESFRLRESWQPIELVYLHFCSMREMDTLLRPSTPNDILIHPWQLQMLLCDALTESEYLVAESLTVVQRLKAKFQVSTERVFSGGVFRQYLLTCLSHLPNNWLDIEPGRRCNTFFEAFLPLLDVDPLSPWSLHALFEQPQLVQEIWHALETIKDWLHFMPAVQEFHRRVCDIYQHLDQFPRLVRLQIVEKPVGVISPEQVLVKMIHSDYPQTFSLADVRDLQFEGFQDALEALLRANGVRM